MASNGPSLGECMVETSPLANGVTKLLPQSLFTLPSSINSLNAPEIVVQDFCSSIGEFR